MKPNIALVIPIIAGALLIGCESGQVRSAAPANAAAGNATLGGSNGPQPAESARLNSIRIGMAKMEVESILGTPDSSSAQANAEYLTYYLGTANGRDEPYLIRLVDGKVESFGRFSELRDLYYRPVGGYRASPGSDVATQLEELKALKDQGALTDEEFQKAKTALLSQP